MENLNTKDIHDKYVKLGVKNINSIKSFNSIKSKKELLNLLKFTEEEYINHISGLPKTLISESDTSNRKLLSLTTLRTTLIQHIGQTVLNNINGLGGIRTIEQLVDRIIIDKNQSSKELSENLIKKNEELPQPNIEGKVQQIREIILPPDIFERLETSFLGGLKKMKRNLVGFDKIGLVEKFLSDYLGRERNTFIRKTGVLRSNQMRKVSYYHLYLPEINKTLLLNNQYGEGCFLFDGNFDIREAKKSDIKGTKGLIELFFDYNNPIGFLNRLEIYLQKNKESEKILNLPENHKSNHGIFNKLTSLNKEEIKEGLDELGGYEALMKYSVHQINGDVEKNIKALRIKGHGVKSLATKYGFISKYNLSFQKKSGFQEFVSYVYDKEFEYTKEKKEEITKEEIKEGLDELGGYETLMKYTVHQINGDVEKNIKALRIKGHRVNSLATKYGFISKYDLFSHSKSGFQEFISDVYDKEFEYKEEIKEKKEEITKEEIKEGLDELGGYETLMKYSFHQINGDVEKNIKALRIKGHGVKSLATKYGFISKYNLLLRHKIGFQEFVSYVYDKEFEYTKEEITKEEIKEGLDELGGYETLMMLTTDQIIGNKKRSIKSLKSKGTGMIALATKYGFISKYNLSFQSKSWFQEFVSYVYDKEFKYEKKLSHNILKNF